VSGDLSNAALLLGEQDWRRLRPFRAYFPDTGPFRRELYPRSMLFFAAGKTYRERLFLAANRTGKTVTAAYETTAHLTGDYPTWWPGRKFEGPIEAWPRRRLARSPRSVADWLSWSQKHILVTVFLLRRANHAPRTRPPVGQ
jgi:hypothetical protein